MGCSLLSAMQTPCTLFAPTLAAGKFQGQATRVDGSALGRAYRTDLVMGESFLQSGVRFGIVKCQLTERGFQFPDCRARRMLEGAEGDQRNTVTAVAFGLKQIIAAVYRLRDCGLCLGFARRWHRRAAGPHDRIPCLAFQPIGLADFRFRCASDEDRFLEVAIVDAVSIANPFCLRLSVAAGQGNMDDARGHKSASLRQIGRS